MPQSSEVGEATPAGDGAKEIADPMRTAQELWEMMTSNEPNGLSQADRRARLRKLRPEMAAFFIRKFRESTAQDLGRQMALEMAMACGGPDAAALLEELEANKTDRFSRLNLKVAVSVLGYGNLTRRPKEFPVGHSLMARTRALLVSGNSEDRGVAVIILGFVDSAQALPLLTSVVQADPDPFVRQAAIRELGRIGDASTLEFLRASRDTLGPEIHKLYKPIAGGDGSVMLLSPGTFTKAIDDAIEELEERLQKK